MDLKKQGVGDTEIQNPAVDKRRNSELAALAEAWGPFTKLEQVDNFMEWLMDDKEMNKRLYLEIRYARDSASVAFPKTSDIFKLKKNYRNLESLVYAANFKAYLGKLVCHVNMGHSHIQFCPRKDLHKSAPTF